MVKKKAHQKAPTIEELRAQVASTVKETEKQVMTFKVNVTLSPWNKTADVKPKCHRIVDCRWKLGETQPGMTVWSVGYAVLSDSGKWFRAYEMQTELTEPTYWQEMEMPEQPAQETKWHWSPPESK